MKYKFNSFKKSLKIPALAKGKSMDMFNQNRLSPFGQIDSNLAAWLPQNFEKTNKQEVFVYLLLDPLNNKEVVQAAGGKHYICNNQVFTPAQIRHLVEKQKRGQKGTLLVNGLSNLFFVENRKSDTLYLLGTVWDKTVHKWTPYIYRLQNLYRAWSKGNQLLLNKRKDSLLE